MQSLTKPEFINLGGHGLVAIAAWFVDQFDLTKQSLFYPSIKSYILDLILDHYFLCYPTEKRQAEIPLQNIKQLVLNHSKLELVEKLAYVFGEIAFAKLCDNSMRFAQVFLDVSPNTTALELKQNVINHPNKLCLIALAEALKIPLELQTIEFNKVIYARESYLENKSNLHSIVLQVQGQTYFMPLMYRKAWHDVLLQAKPHQSAFPLSVNVDLSILQSNIIQENQILFEKTKHYYTQLDAVAMDEKLTKKDWIQLYINHLSFENISMNYEKCQLQHNISPAYLHSEVALTQAIKWSIAEAMARGMISEDILDQYLDLQAVPVI